MVQVKVSTIKTLASHNCFGLWSFSVRRIISPTVRKKRVEQQRQSQKKVPGHSSLGQACLCCLSSTELRVQLKIRCKRVVKYCACDHLWMPVMTRVLSLSAPKNPVWKSPFLIFTLPWSKLSMILRNNFNFVCLFIQLDILNERMSDKSFWCQIHGCFFLLLLSSYTYSQVSIKWASSLNSTEYC